MKSINRLLATINKYKQVIAILTLWLTAIAIGVLLSFQHPLDISFPYYDTDLVPFYTRLISIFAYFDGIHYLRIAKHGYIDMGTQAFFPIYPLILKIFSHLFSSPITTAIIINIISLILSLYGIFLLFPNRKMTIISYLLFFPTSFFLLTVYTESLFLALSIWFFVFLKQKRWYLAALISGLASATRLVGSILIVSLFIDYYQNKSKYLSIIPILFLGVSGFVGYTLYLYIKFSDPLLFAHVQSMFGANRSTDQLILLPQVIYRYLRIFFTVPMSSHLFILAVFELTSFIVALTLIVVYWSARNLSLNLYLLFSILLPTFTGTLSSIPRYILVLIPFLIYPVSINTKSKFTTLLVLWASLVFFVYQFSIGQFVA